MNIIHVPTCPDILLYVITVVQAYYPTYESLVN